MKKLSPTLLAFVACMSQISFANAETTYYPEAEHSDVFYDYFANFSKDSYTLESGEDKALHFQFYNYTVGVNNWQNWALCGVSDLANVHDNGKDKQLFVLRCDAWENVGGQSDQGTKDSDYNWGTFRKDMDGSYVDMTVKYDSTTGTFTMTSTITTADKSKMYNYNWTKTLSTKPEKLYLYFECEKSYISQNKAAEALKTYYPESTAKVTTGAYWSNPSIADYAIEPGQKLNFKFYNYSSKDKIWNNWLLCGIKDKTLKDDRDKPEFILRTDNFELKANNGNNCLSDDNNDAEDVWKANLDGALVDMDVTYYASGRLGVYATITKGERSYIHTYYKDIADKSKLYLFFQGDGSYIDVPTSPVSISNDMIYATYSNPTYSVDFSDSDVKAYIITSTDGSKLTFKEVTKIPANTGVLLVGAKSATATVKATDAELDDVSGNLLVADDGTTKAPANSYILTIKDAQPGFYKSKESRMLEAGKAHLELTSAMATTCESFALDALGVLTGIAGVQATVDADKSSSADCYNTAGQRVGTSYKGIVVRNGKKMIQK